MPIKYKALCSAAFKVIPHLTWSKYVQMKYICTHINMCNKHLWIMSIAMLIYTWLYYLRFTCARICINVCIYHCMCVHIIHKVAIMFIVCIHTHTYMGEIFWIINLFHIISWCFPTFLLLYTLSLQLVIDPLCCFGFQKLFLNDSGKLHSPDKPDPWNAKRVSIVSICMLFKASVWNFRCILLGRTM